jgi:hypothetical protein
MFHTYPQAELRLLPPLAPDGERSWRWVELAVHIPIYYLSANVKVSEDATCGREFLFGHLRDMLGLMAASRDEFLDMQVGLMTPGHMNGSGFYQLSRVKEIWERRSDHKKMFVMTDGAKLFHPTDEDDGISDKEMELVISL